jgi:leucine dehydrogenase
MVYLYDVPTTGYEKVVKIIDDDSELVGFIAVHNSKIGHAKDGLGVSLGGLRMLPYIDDTEALKDVLDLSAGMTRKSAAADDGVGGAKAVIIADPKKYPQGSEERRKLMLAMGEAIEKFGNENPVSAYMTAEDMNTSPADMKIIAEKTQFVSGLPYGEFDGNPSPFTAQGVLAAMKEAMGVNSMNHKKVAIAGLGNVGGKLAELLIDEGAQLIVTDVDDKPEKLKKQYPAHVQVVSPADIHKQDVDVYAPCARGQCLNDATIPQIKAKYIVGAANNQLAEPRHGQMLKDAGKIYIPDFVANAGGVIAVAMEVKHRREKSPLTKKDIADVVEQKIRANTKAVLEIARDRNIPESDAGEVLARDRLAHADMGPDSKWTSRTTGKDSTGKGWAHGS